MQNPRNSACLRQFRNENGEKSRRLQELARVILCCAFHRTTWKISSLFFSFFFFSFSFFFRFFHKKILFITSEFVFFYN